MDKIALQSSAFEAGGLIPPKYSCDGEGASPPLRWGAVPAATQSLALTLSDPDAPSGDFVHWILYDLPPDLQELPEGVGQQTQPGGGVQGRTSRRQEGYVPPCPPGEVHRYVLVLYALDKRLGLRRGADKRTLLNAMKGHILAQGELIGRYGRR